VDSSFEIDRLVEQIGDELLARLHHRRAARQTSAPAPLPRPIYAAQAPAPAAGLRPGAEGLEIPDVVCPGCVQRCPQTCAGKTQAVVAAGADRVSASDRLTDIDSAIAPLIDHTLLRPEATRDQIARLCEEARRFRFASVCVNPLWVALCARLLRGSGVKVCTVVGFPLGATLTGVKRAETREAVKLGAEEIDMVIQIGALRSGDLDGVYLDIRAVVETAHRANAIVKVIIEAALLEDEEKITACALAKLAGAEFVKTSTGFGPSGATSRDVALMRRVVGGEMGIKAAGGIRTFADLQKMTAAGATRIGASASVKILQEARAQGTAGDGAR
jgi:deoxyribose-phosphate aldolase